MHRRYLVYYFLAVATIAAFMWGMKTKTKPAQLDAPRPWSAAEDHLIRRLNLPTPFFIVMKDGRKYLAKQYMKPGDLAFGISEDCYHGSTLFQARFHLGEIEKVVTQDEAEFSYLAREYILK